MTKTTKTPKPAAKKRGRQFGSGMGVKLGPRPGSRPFTLLSLKSGVRILFEAPPGRATALMQQIQADTTRNGIKVKQAIVLGVQPDTRELLEIVAVTRIDKAKPIAVQDGSAAMGAVHALAALIDKLAETPAAELNKGAVGLVNDAWDAKNEIVGALS